MPRIPWASLYPKATPLGASRLPLLRAPPLELTLTRAPRQRSTSSTSSSNSTRHDASTAPRPCTTATFRHRRSRGSEPRPSLPLLSLFLLLVVERWTLFRPVRSLCALPHSVFLKPSRPSRALRLGEFEQSCGGERRDESMTMQFERESSEPERRAGAAAAERELDSSEEEQRRAPERFGRG